jgi:hypothetical protein
MCISKIKQTDKTIVELLDGTQEGIGYTYDEKLAKIIEIDINNKNCLVKKIKIKDKKNKYYLIFSLDFHLYNPWGMYNSGKLKNYMSKTGKSFWAFKEVAETTFNRYMRFLETKNESHLLIAERETKDA